VVEAINGELFLSQLWRANRTGNGGFASRRDLPLLFGTCSESALCQTDPTAGIVLTANPSKFEVTRLQADKEGADLSPSHENQRYEVVGSYTKRHMLPKKDVDKNGKRVGDEEVIEFKVVVRQSERDVWVLEKEDNSEASAGEEQEQNELPSLAPKQTQPAPETDPPLRVSP